MLKLGTKPLSVVSWTLIIATAAFPQGTGTPLPAAAEHDVKDLAKETQNPVGDIISLPFQFNFNNGGALRDETYFNLNFQPVIPVHPSQLRFVVSFIFPTRARGK